MPRLPVKDEEIIKAMNKLFEAVGPFEPALRKRDRGVVLDNQVPDADRMTARMIELEKALCSVYWSILLLNSWKHKEGIDEEKLRVKIRKNRLSLYEEIEDLHKILQHVRRWGVAAKALEETDAGAYQELVMKIKKVFTSLKKHASMNFVYGSSSYLGGLKCAIEGAWLGRSLSWSAVVTDDMNFAIAGLDSFVEHLSQRAKSRVRTESLENMQNINMLTKYKGVKEHWEGAWISDSDIEVYDDQEDIELGMYDDETEDGEDGEGIEGIEGSEDNEDEKEAEAAVEIDDKAAL